MDNGVFQSGEIGMHPGPNDQFGVVQFSATTPGLYDIKGTFEGLDLGGATNTLVDLLFNNVPVVSGNVIGDGPGSDVPLSFGPVFLNVGDTLAYAVGGNPFEGSTGLVPGSAFVAAAIPEPSTFVLLGLGIMGVFGYAVRRRVGTKPAVE